MENKTQKVDLAETLTRTLAELMPMTPEQALDDPHRAAVCAALMKFYQMGFSEGFDRGAAVP